MKILVAIDGSMLGLLAVQRFCDFALRMKELPDVHLLYVETPIPSALATLPTVGDDTVKRYYTAEAEAVLHPAMGRLAKKGIVATPHSVLGDPADTVVAQAAALECTLIWLGAHGKSSGQGPILGSVAARVVHLAKCAVMISR
jgi:nucleotide-binding universal stress UspA family protein